MTSYRFDLYPRTDPRDGTLVHSFLPELTDGVLTGGLLKAAYRSEANGTSTGQLAVRSTSEGGQAIDPLGLQYVRVVELPGGSVRGGFFLEKGKFQALSEDEDSLLTFSGAGTLAYLARAAMAPHTYLDTAIGTDPYDDTWRWGDQGPAAGGDFIGAALWRVIYEAQHFRVPGTQHRHADGAIYTDSHDDDRTESAIPDVVMTFDQYTDSSGNAWTIPSGDLRSQVGDNVLSVVKRLMEAGLYVELDPDTFELNAWEQDVHRVMLDATGSAWATDVVRFQAPTDPDDITTGNIKDDAVRNIEAHIKRSALWAGGSDVYGLSTSPSDIPWEGFYRADTDDTEALEAIAANQLQAIADAGDTLKLQLWMDDDPANGRYLPFDHVKLDQSVTVHTGTDQWEFDERTFPVAAITVELRQGGNWQAIVELGASYSAIASRSFQVKGGAHSHLPNPELCRAGGEATPPTLVDSGTGKSDDQFQIPITVDGEADGALYVAVLGSPASVTWRPGFVNLGTPGTSVAMTQIATVTTGGRTITVWRLLSPTDSTTGTSAVLITGSWQQAGAWYLSGVDQSAPEGVTTATGTGTVSAISIAAGASDLILDAAGWSETNAIVTTPTVAGSQVSIGAEQTDRTTGFQDFASGYGAGSDSSPAWNFTNSHAWAAVAVAVAPSDTGTGGDGPPEVIGHSNRAARCDHNHHHNDLLDLNVKSGGHEAAAINITDAGGYFTGTDVEAALQELGAGIDDAASIVTDLSLGTPANVSTTGSPAFLNFPGIAKLDADHLLVVYRQATDHATSDDGKIVYKIGTIGTDYAVTWGSQSDVIDGALDYRDPEVAVLSDGTPIVSYFTWDGSTSYNIQTVTGSWDGSTLTWDSPVSVSTSFTAEACTAKVVELFNGDLILPVYGNNGGNHTAALVRSTDGGTSWGSQTTIVTGTVGDGNNWTEPYIIRLADGRLHCLIREDTDKVIYRSVSSDGGATWSTATVAFTGAGRPAHIQVQSGGLLYVSRPWPEDDTVYRESSDYGVTWTDETTLDTSGTKAEYASIVQIDPYRYGVAYAVQNTSSDADVKFVVFTDAANLDIIRGIGEGVSTGGIGAHDHDADYANIAHTHPRWEVVVSGSPPEAVYSGSDWLYAEVS